MHKLYKNKKKPPAGDKLWRNPTERLLKIVIHRGAKRTVEEVEAGAELALPAAWSEKTVKKVCKALVPADSDVPPAPKLAPAAVPEAAAEPLGDPSKVQSEHDRKEGKEATHSSGDALESYAQTLMKNSRAALIGMAEDLGLDATGDKIAICRAIALKSTENAKD